MRSYSDDMFSEIEQFLLRLAGVVGCYLPDIMTLGTPARCHEVARVVARVAERYAGRQVLWVQDGRYGYCDHSWLWTSVPDIDRSWPLHSCPNILDPYCVGSLPVARLVSCGSSALPHFGLMYQLGPARNDVDERWVDEMSSTISDLLIASLREGLSQLPSWERVLELESLRARKDEDVNATRSS